MEAKATSAWDFNPSKGPTHTLTAKKNKSSATTKANRIQGASADAEGSGLDGAD